VTSLYNQGDFVMVNFDPTTGHEPKKRRPALVVSTDSFNNVLSSLTVVCPVTSVDNGYPLHIKIADANCVSGFVCVEQLRSVDLRRRDALRLDEPIDMDTMTKVLDAIAAIFNI